MNSISKSYLGYFFYLFILVTFSSVHLCSQNLHVSEWALNEIDLITSSPSKNSIEISATNVPTNLHAFDNYADGKYVLFGYTNPLEPDFGPNNPSVIILDKDLQLERYTHYDKEGACKDKIYFAKVINDKDLLLITTNLDVYHIPDFETSSLNLCEYQPAFTIGNENYSSIRANEVIEIGSYLTVACSAKNLAGKSGAFQSIINLNNISQQNVFFVPVDEGEYSSFCYLDSDRIAIAFNKRTNLETESFIYITDWQRNILDTLNFEEGFAIGDIEKSSTNEILISGALQKICETTLGTFIVCVQHGYIKKVNTSGDLLWEDIALDDPYSYYYDMEIANTGEIFIIANYRRDNSTVNRQPILIRKFNQEGELLANKHIGTTSYTYSSQDFKLDANDNPVLLSNYEHTGIHVSYLNTFKSELSSTEEIVELNSFFAIYPNPFQETFSIKRNNSNSDFTYKIFDSQARLIDQGTTTNNIDATQYERGVYYIHVREGTNNQVMKIIKI